MFVRLCSLGNLCPHWGRWVVGGGLESHPQISVLLLPLPQAAAGHFLWTVGESTPPSLKLLQPGISTEARKATGTHRWGKIRKHVFEFLVSPLLMEAECLVPSCHSCLPHTLRSQNSSHHHHFGHLSISFLLLFPMSQMKPLYCPLVWSTRERPPRPCIGALFLLHPSGENVKDAWVVDFWAGKGTWSPPPVWVLGWILSGWPCVHKDIISVSVHQKGSLTIGSNTDFFNKNVQDSANRLLFKNSNDNNICWTIDHKTCIITFIVVIIINYTPYWHYQEDLKEMQSRHIEVLEPMPFYIMSQFSTYLPSAAHTDSSSSMV